MSDKPGIIERLMADIDLIDAAQACALLWSETDATEAAMKSLVRAGAVIDIDGQVALSRFPFDLRVAHIFGIVTAILKMRPTRIRNLRLVYWLTRPPMDFDCAPVRLKDHRNCPNALLWGPFNCFRQSGLDDPRQQLRADA